MNRLSGAEAFVRMLQRHGVTHVFGLCGDTSLPLYDALARLDHGITHVLTRDERSAAYMADAYARVTGRVGVCEGPSGGGATYILPGVVEANESSVPILAVTTDISVSSRGRYTLTELDQESLFRPLAKWNKVLDRAAEIPGTLRRAFREMTTGRPGAVHIGLPYDVQKDPVEESDVWADPAYGRYPAARVAPDPAAVARAADVLAAAARPVIVCGGGAVIAGAEAELARLAEILGAPVATTISGQGTIADAHPLAVGVVGSNGGTPPTRAVIDAADAVLFVGCRAGSVTTERWRHPTPGAARIVHVDVDPAVIGTNYETAAGVVGDAKLALAALADALVLAQAKPRDAAAAQRVARARADKEAAYRPLATSNERPIRPERLIADLAAVLSGDAIVVADPGTPCPYVSAFYPKRRTGRWFISNRAHGALGYSLS
ncbi:MAG: thiamine pyrophosphate-binding protein, partial [Rhodospirillales bacterium]|nr:thiamine pyrophosphate-binding protein [Rhodospirillales bacterium]